MCHYPYESSCDDFQGFCLIVSFYFFLPLEHFIHFYGLLTLFWLWSFCITILLNSYINFKKKKKEIGRLILSMHLCLISNLVDNMIDDDNLGSFHTQSNTVEELISTGTQPNLFLVHRTSDFISIENHLKTC